MLAVILNQHLIKKERAVKMQKQRIPPNPTTKQEILFLRRMGFPAQKKMKKRKPIGKKNLLFRREHGFVTPGFASYAEARKFWNYPDNARLEVRVRQTYDVAEM